MLTQPRVKRLKGLGQICAGFKDDPRDPISLCEIHPLGKAMSVDLPKYGILLWKSRMTLPVPLISFTKTGILSSVVFLSPIRLCVIITGLGICAFSQNQDGE